MFKKLLSLLFCLAAFFMAAGQQKQITLEGTLRMLVVSAEGDGGYVSEWQETNFDDYYLNFVLQTDSPIDIKPYLAPEDLENIDVVGEDNQYFTLRSEKISLGKQFASKYANRRVKITGTLYISIAGWRNSPPMMFEVKDIKLVETGENLFTPESSLNDGEDKVFTVVDEQASFPGGETALYKFLGSHIEYPEKAREKGITGIVLVKFVVEKDGRLSNIEIVKGIGGGCDEEVLRVMKTMPPWIPGKVNGKKIRTEFKLPVAFDLR